MATEKKTKLHVKIEKETRKELFTRAKKLDVPLYWRMSTEELRDLMIEVHCPETAHL